jgi:hypothetical protein
MSASRAILDIMNSVEQSHFEMPLTRPCMPEVCSAQKGKHARRLLSTMATYLPHAEPWRLCGAEVVTRRRLAGAPPELR